VQGVRLAQELYDDPADAFRWLKAIEDSRSEAEDDMREALEALFAKWRSRFARAIAAGEPPPFDEFSEELARIMGLRVSQVMTDEVLRHGMSVGVEFDPALINEAALNWARTYTYDLMRGREKPDGTREPGLDATTRKQVQQIMATWQERPGMTRGELEAMLEPAFGPNRASMIAVTEVTRASSAATRHYQQQVAEAGITMQRYWYTLRDERVCPICGPLHGKPETEWADKFPEGPPAHVNCRCSTTLRLVQ